MLPSIHRWPRLLGALTLAAIACSGPEASRRNDVVAPEREATPLAIAPSATVANTLASSSARGVQHQQRNAQQRQKTPLSLSKATYLWLASSCHIDELGPSAYTSTRRNYKVPRSALPKDAIPLVKDGDWLPEPESRGEAKRAAAIERDWTQQPAKSRVIDCSFLIKQRYCSHCAGGQNKQAHYVAYLPKALFERAADVHSILTVIPGGRGGRHRPFLTPLPGKTVFQRSSGGLEIKQRVDAWLHEHPGANEPIVVATQSHGAEYPNGSLEYLGYDLPRHLSDAFLGGRPLSKLVLGAEGISSGATAIVRLLHAKPGRLSTVGLTCMSCFLVDPGRHSAREQFQHETWAATLTKQRSAGRFAMRFNIGSRDGQLPCNRRFYTALADGGLFDKDKVAFSNCHETREADSDHCDTQRDGWAQWHDEMHHYAMLNKSYPSQIRWHLEQLNSIVAKRQRAAAPTP